MRHTSLYRLFWRKDVRVYLCQETVTHTLKQWVLLCAVQALHTRPHPELLQQAIVNQRRSGRAEARSASPPRLHPPHYDHPPRLHQSGDDGGRRFLVANPDILESTAASRPQNLSPLDRAGGHVSLDGSRMSPPHEAHVSSQYRHSQYSVHPPPYQHGFDLKDFHQFGVMDITEDRAERAQPAHRRHHTTLLGPVIVSPPSPNTVSVEMFPSNFSESGTVEGRKADRDIVNGSQEEGGSTSYLDLFERRPLETDSINNRGESTPLSDQSSILVPRHSACDILPSLVKRMQNQLQSKDVPRSYPAKPTARPQYSRSNEASLHCDELNLPPHRPLSKLEKAVLRLTEFGGSADLSRVQLA
jgi:hypothetical protein